MRDEPALEANKSRISLFGVSESEASAESLAFPAD